TSMKTTPPTQQTLLTAFITAALASSLLAQENKTPPSEARLVEQLVSVTAKVESIDIAKRELTLRGPLGNAQTFVVSDQVKRLNEIRHGDEVTVKYYIGIAAELRAPSAEEKTEPFVVLETKERAIGGTPPAGGGTRIVRVVATVEGLDRLSQTATLKGPRG